MSKKPPYKELEKALIPKAFPRYKEVELPGTNRVNDSFAKDMGDTVKQNTEFFFKPSTNEIVEIRTYKEKISKKETTVFVPLNSKRLLNILETKIRTYKMVWNDTKKEYYKIYKTSSETNIKLLMENTHFQNSLNKVDRLLQYPMFFIRENKLIKSKKGYDERINSFLINKAPELNKLSVQESKDILYEMIDDFCFKSEVDKIMAISAIITPACRGLYEEITARTPIFLIMANRERAGKDYLAGCIGIIYEGIAKEDPPVSTDDRTNSNAEELRKKLTSGLKQGRRRFHWANNRGNIRNAVLEGFITNPEWVDRELGKNIEVSLNNETDNSMSANSGITYTPDFWHRTRQINLFLPDEHPNKRKFGKENLHLWIKNNRGRILSAINTLIYEWFEAGKPLGKTPFSSFPEWAKIVGGIMTFHKFGDPCQTLADIYSVGGDHESKNMKKLWNLMYDFSNKTGQKEFFGYEIRNFVQNKQETEGIFESWNFIERKYQISFGRLLGRFIGRLFDDIKMETTTGENTRSDKTKYRFIKIRE